MSTKKLLLVGIIMSSLIIISVNAQLENGHYNFESDFTKLGVQFKFDNGWADEFNGKLYPINETSFIIEWYRYDDETPLKNETFSNINADSYDVSVDVYTFANNTKFYARFEVEWYNQTELLDISVSDGYLVIRDKDRVARTYDEIIRVRKYIYSVGDMVGY